MGKPLQGSINFSGLLAAAKKGHTAFVKAGKNNHIFVNVTLWENDVPDQFGNTMSLQVNPKKDSGDDKFYIGNFRPSKIKEPEGLRAGAVDVDENDLPF
jgi:hypothetical protein